MKPNIFFACIFSLIMLLLASCSLAATNNPGTVFLPGSVPYDHDATNFIARAGINPRGAEAKAIGRLVVDLKQANLWTNLDALYPFVGGTSNGCAQNLVSSNYAIAWHGGVTFTGMGAKGNGTDGWGDTSYLQSSRGVLTNDFHLYGWLQKNNDELTGSQIIGNQNGFNSYGGVGFLGTHVTLFQLQTNANGLGGSGVRVYGNAISVRSGTTTILMGDDPTLFTNVVAAIRAAPTNSVHILGNLDFSGDPAETYARATVGAASFGRSLTPTQATNYFTIMTRFQSGLRRNATIGIVTP